MKTKALATRTRKSDINVLIQKINGCQFSMFDNYVEIGGYLGIIKEDKLFQPEGYGTFADFLKDQKRHGFQFTPAEAWQATRIAELVGAIKEMRDRQPEDIKELVPMPSSQSQLKPLMKLPGSRAGDTWISVALHAHKVQTPITHQFMSDFVNNTGKIIDQEPEPKEPGTVHDIDFATQTDGEPPPRFSAAALECLSKVESMMPHTFPDGSRASIEQELTKGVDNYSLELWNKHPTNEFKAIGRLIFYRDMSFDKAQRFVMRPITQSSTIMDLVHAAVAFGGSFRIKVDDGRFVISIAETSDQPAEAVA